MKLTQRTPEARQAYFQGYTAGLAMAISRLESLGRECCGGGGDEINHATGKRYGEPFFMAADSIKRMVPTEIIETFEMK